MSRNFKDWLIWTAIATVLIEIVAYFLFVPEARWIPIHQCLMWFFLPVPAIMFAFALSILPRSK